MQTSPALKILLVDDDAALLDALRFSLELEGFDVETFSSGEALLMRDPPPPDACLVLDQKLPGASGLATLVQLRERNVALPALLITSHPNPALRAAAAQAGVRIVEKPLIGDALVESIRSAMNA
jgi:FixJ family two-component response regulator